MTTHTTYTCRNNCCRNGSNAAEDHARAECHSTTYEQYRLRLCFLVGADQYFISSLLPQRSMSRRQKMYPCISTPTKGTRKTIITWHFSNKNDLSTEVNNVDSIYVYRYFDNGWQKKTEIRIVSHRRSVVAQSDVCCLVNNPAPERNASFRSCNKRVDSFNNLSFQFGQLWQKHQQTNSPAKWDDQRFHSHVGRLKQISPIGPSSVA